MNVSVSYRETLPDDVSFISELDVPGELGGLTGVILCEVLWRALHEK